ncbi:hypothetical protein SAMN02745824_3366 [Parasphingorhabdus marina DSM 22363]|uniref:Uncharacterized protein n=1 Tax=Parasphingorhabdus marina DSM 22363 TaxID=1123272 RepID=A0A1N6HMV4_9SPHN|nr:hypothetical protein SAMN02745824_3366 [Parasphingorhabdus marina DSM 22363]
MEKARGARGRGDLVQPPQRIIGQRRGLRARSRDQAVFDIIGEGCAAVRGQIAIGVIGEARGAGGAVLIETVGGVVAVLF